jgi:hypothetical protein
MSTMDPLFRSTSKAFFFVRETEALSVCVHKSALLSHRCEHRVQCDEHDVLLLPLREVSERASAHSRNAAFVHRVETAEENCACLASLQVHMPLQTHNARLLFFFVRLNRRFTASTWA